MKYNFIIPYRNRKDHLNEFIQRFTSYLEGKDIDVHFYIIHQMNPKEFNRGAMKNIGFLEVCKTRSDGLFIFHDVDTYPTNWESIPYETKKGTIKRPVDNGWSGNVGLICCCWKEEYEKTNGYPNYWGWGSEDCALYYRAKKHGIPIEEGKMIHYQDTQHVINRNHDRNANKQYHQEAVQNENLVEKEKQTGNFSNGLSSLHYEVICSVELAPRFTMINVDFTLS